MESPLWCVKYRPVTWTDFVGQDKAIEQLRRMSQSGTCPNMIFLGPTGTGKTRAAEVFAREFLGPAFNSNYLWLNVRDLRTYPLAKAKRPIQALAKLSREERTSFDEYMSVVYKEAKETARLRGKSGEPNRSDLLHEAIHIFASTLTITTDLVKILVLDEADAMDINMQQALRRTMEIYSDVCRFILITPTLSGWIPAILSRCVIVHFGRIPADYIVEMLRKIADAENVMVDKSTLRVIARESDGDMRRAINILQMAAAKTGRVSEDEVYECAESTLTRAVREIVSLAIDGSFVQSRNKMKELLALENYAPSLVLHEIQQDLLRRPFDDATLYRLMERLAEIDFRMTQAKNPFIQIEAFLASIWAEVAEAESRT